MKFNNTPNKLYKTTCGKDLWHSRSVAVSVVLIHVNYLLNKKEIKVLVNKRGVGCLDAPGLWNVVCGYLDWNESANEAAFRELYEECGIDIFKIDYICLKNNLLAPYCVNSLPSANRQNVTLRYGALITSDKTPEVNSKNSEKNEIADIKWIDIEELDKYEFAFDHYTVIKEYFELIKSFI